MKPSREHPHQLSFNEPLVDFVERGPDSKVTYHKVPAKQATFKAGLAASIHRWFRLTPSFGPELVREMLSKLECSSEDVVLDPFAGAGTTLIECQLEGLKAYGFEINPFLHWVGSTCLDWELDSSVLERALESIREKFDELDKVVNLQNLERYELEIPRIHNPTRWWRPDVLKHLLILKSSIESLEYKDSIKSFFQLALAAVLVPDLSNVTLGRLQLHFIDRDHHDIQVMRTFISHAENMIEDVRKLAQLGLRNTSKVLHSDATRVGSSRLSEAVSCVVTSPPYPNRYSYVWNTRPHLYFLDFFSSAKEAADLDKLTIGGTWGTATSSLAKGRVVAEFPIVDEVVGPATEAIRSSDNLMANYAMKYFNLLAKQIVEMDKLLTRDARVAYVVGCSRLKGVYIETDVMLGQIFEGLGLSYEVSAIERFRRRHSGTNLHESVIYAWKQ